MKMRKKAALAAVIFSAALNTACAVYGPPPEDWDREEKGTEIVSNDTKAQTEAETGADVSDETEGDESQ